MVYLIVGFFSGAECVQGLMINNFGYIEHNLWLRLTLKL